MRREGIPLVELCLIEIEPAKKEHSYDTELQSIQVPLLFSRAPLGHSQNNGGPGFKITKTNAVFCCKCCLFRRVCVNNTGKL